MIEINGFYSLAGFVVGILIGLTGVGGGSLMTPLLVLLFNFHPATAVGTDLLYASVTKTVGSAAHGWRGTVDWRIVGRLAAGSVPASLLTLGVLYKLGSPSAFVAHVITMVLGAALVLTACAIIFRTSILAFAARRRSGENPARTAVATIGLGAALGVLVSLTSVGAGALGVTALLLLYPKLSIRRIVGTDIAHAVPLTLIGGLGHWLIGSVDLHLLGSLLIGSIPGVIIGSALAGRMSDKALQPILAVILLIVGGKLLL